MFGLSFEHFLILGIALLIFGPKRLPDLGHGIGKGIKNFRDAFTSKDEEPKKIESDVSSKSDPGKPV